MRRIFSVLVSSALLLAGLDALSAESATNPTRDRLEKELRRSNPNPAGMKLGALERDRRAFRQARIREMIQKLESGQSVDTKQIDEVLGEAAPWR
jgi:hypothetical protein